MGIGTVHDTQVTPVGIAVIKKYIWQHIGKLPVYYHFFRVCLVAMQSCLLHICAYIESVLLISQTVIKPSLLGNVRIVLSNGKSIIKYGAVKGFFVDRTICI